MSKVLFLISPSLNALADRQKGTAGNKIDCAFQHYTNSTRSNIEIGATLGLASLFGRSAAIKALNAAGTTAGPLKTFFESLKKAPAPVKYVAGALVALSLLVRTYKKGTIEQKYIDRAQFVDNTFKLEANAAAPIAKK